MLILKKSMKRGRESFQNHYEHKLSCKKSVDVLPFKTMLTRIGNLVLKIFDRLLLRKYIAVPVKASKSVLGQFL